MDLYIINQEFQKKWLADLKNLELSIYQLGVHLSILRKAAGWSAEELSSKIGVTKQTINSIEQGIKEYDIYSRLATEFKNVKSKDEKKSVKEELDKALYTLNYPLYYTLRCLFEREIATKCNPFLAYIYKYYILDNHTEGQYLEMFNVYDSIRKIVNSDVIVAMTEYHDRLISGGRQLTSEISIDNALIYPSNPYVIKIRQENVDRLLDGIDKIFGCFYHEIGIESKDDLKTFDYQDYEEKCKEWKSTFFNVIERKESTAFKNMIVSDEFIASKKMLNKIEKASKLDDSGWTSISN